MRQPASAWRHHGYAFLDRTGIRGTGTVVDRALDETVSSLETSPPASGLIALDAGCGRKSPLAAHKRRFARLIGVDIHPPERLPGYLDEFAVVDLCGPGTDLPADTFDLVLSNFTIEHFADPETAVRNLARCLRPGGAIVVSTVNRRHPFVAAYLGLPARLRARLQPVVKASAADAHPLVGACNEPAAVVRALRDAGLEDVRLEMVSNLAHAWGRRPGPFVLGVVGDLLCHTMPLRRSTIVAQARKPSASSSAAA